MILHPPRFRLLLGLALAALCLPFLGAEASISVEETETTQAGKAALTVRAFASGGASGSESELKGALGGAAVFLNRGYVGRAPFTAPELEPGTYLVGIEAKGYRSREVVLILKEKRSYELIVVLEPLTGYLELRVDPPDASILVDGGTRRGSLIELPIGSRSVRIRRFGYRERSFEVQIYDRLTTSLGVVLEPAAFSVSALSASRERFYPGNAGSLGRTRINFAVGSFGSGRLEIRDSGGRLVHSADFPAFEDWEQSLLWTGRDESGSTLPDGEYRVRLEARAQKRAAEEPELFVKDLLISLDSSLAARPLGSAGALPGLRYFPEPSLPPAGIAIVDLAWRALQDEGSFLEASAAYSFGGLLLGLAAELNPDASAARKGGFSAGLLAPLGRARNPELALAARFSYKASSSSLFGAELLLPLGFALGGLHYGIAPGLELSLPGDFAGAELGLQARAGLWLLGPAYRAGFSAAAKFEGLTGFSLPRARLEAALEGRLLLGTSPLILSGALLAGLPAEGGTELGFVLGLGLFF